MPSPYPAGAPTVNGSLITVDAFLKSPPMVQKAITDLTKQRFIADEVFAAGPTAVGGAVMFDQITEGEWFSDRDVQAIAAGAEFPVVSSGQSNPKVAAVTKWGGAAVVTYEQVRRDRRDVLAKELTKLRNTIVRKIDTVAVAALEAAVDANLIPDQPASDDWTDEDTDIRADLETARSTIDEQDLGYEADTVLLNPEQALGVRLNNGLQTALPRETMADNLIGKSGLSGLLRFPRWYVSNRVAPGDVWVTCSKQVGSISDELPLYSRVVNDELRERYVIMAARIAVPFITDPLCTVKITGA